MWKAVLALSLVYASDQLRPRNAVVCDATCSTCSNGICSSCTNSAYYIVVADNNCQAACPASSFKLSGYCYKDCPSGFYNDKTTYECKACTSPCSSCENSATICTSCNDPLYLYYGECRTDCPTATYKDTVQRVCIPCGSGCATCSGTECLTCTDSSNYIVVGAKTCAASCPVNYYTLNKMCYITCPDNYFNKSDFTCPQCKSPCANCVNSESSCTSCTSGNYLYNNSCDETCPAGYFKNTQTLRCEACFDECEICTDGNTCTKCWAGTYLSSDDKICDETCGSLEMLDVTDRQCVEYSSRYPTTEVNKQDMNYIKITYSKDIIKGTGSLRILEILTETKDSITTNEVIVISASETINGRVNTFMDTLHIYLYSPNFTVDKSYIIQIDANFIKSSNNYSIEGLNDNTWRFKILSNPVSSLVAVINKGQRGMEIPTGTAISLDASSSYDPSITSNPNLSYTWDCKDYTSSYSSYRSTYGNNWGQYVQSYVTSTDSLANVCGTFFDYTKPPSTLKYEVSSSFRIDNVLRFSFTMKDTTTSRTSTAEIYVRFVSSDITLITIDNLPTYRINTDKPLNVYSPTLIETSNYELTWSFIKLETLNSDPVLLTEVTGSQYLTIAEGSLTSDATYRFTLTLQDSLSNSYGTLQIITNSGPTGGGLMLDKLEGTAITTDFQGQMINWSDLDLPLSYKFRYKIGTYSEISVSKAINGEVLDEYMLAGTDSSGYFTMYFPDGTINILAYAIDSLGASSYVVEQITVKENTELRSIIDKAPSSESIGQDFDVIYENVVKAGNVAIVLEPDKENNTYLDDLKEKLIGVAESGKTKADALFAANEFQQAALLYEAVLVAIEPISRVPLESDKAETLITLCNSIEVSRLEAFLTPSFPNTSITSVSTQQVLSTRDYINISQMMAQTVVNILDQDYTAYIDELNEYLLKSLEVLQLNVQLTEIPRQIETSDLVVFNTKDLAANLKQQTYTMSNGMTVYLPNFDTTVPNLTLVASFVKNNPFESTVEETSFSSKLVQLDSFLSLDLLNSDTQEIIPLEDLTDPIKIQFILSAEDITTMENSLAQYSTNPRIWPECTFWNLTSTAWETGGCNLNNMEEVYNTFELESEVIESVNIVCACNHMSYYTISFRDRTDLVASSYIVREDDDVDFSAKEWATCVAFFFMIGWVVFYIVGLSFAYYWDNFNPSFSSTSAEVKQIYRYIDPHKVEAVLSYLEQMFVQDYVDSASVRKRDITGDITKVLNSKLLTKAMEATEDERHRSETMSIMMDKYPIQRLMNGGQRDNIEVQDEGGVYIPQGSYIHARKQPIVTKIRKYLKKGLNDPAYLPTFAMGGKDVSLEDLPTPSRDDIEKTKQILSHRLYQLDNNIFPEAGLDKFLKRYDETIDLNLAIAKDLKLDDKQLTKEDLQQLGFCPYEFGALRFTSSGKLKPDIKVLSGGKYAKQLVDDINKFYHSLKVSYCSLFTLYLKKEHKLLALFYDLHFEYSKKQMLTLFSLFMLIHLTFIQIYITFINWDFDKQYNFKDNLCSWGCNYEAQIFAGFFIAILPWFPFYLVKYLFAKNMLEQGSSDSWK